MDLWVVAAVTGAGYLGKYWQNLSGEKDDGLSDMYSIHKKLDSKSLLHPLVNQKKLLCNDYIEKKHDPRIEFQEILSASTRNTESNVERYDVNGIEVLTGFGNKKGSDSKKRFLKSRRSRLFIVKPLDISETCLPSELNNEDYGNMEDEYILPPLCTPSVRPLLVTHRTSRDSFDVRIHNMQDSVDQSSGLIELPSKHEQKHSRSSFHLQDLSSSNDTLPFFIGISIGVMSTFAANNREVDRLNELLEHKEEVVQDLHDELEMKEIMKVKENHSITTQTELTADERGKKNPTDNRAESPDLMSKIEAELVAELETLELNMKSARYEGMPEIIKFDSDEDANYAVSPIDLRLRLHELIESRLEARIRELEIALRNNHHRLLKSQNVEDDNNEDSSLMNNAYDEIYEQINDTHHSESEDDEEIFAKLLLQETS